MKAQHKYIGIGVVTALGLLLASYLFVDRPQFSQKAINEHDATVASAAARAAQTQVTLLTRKKNDLPKAQAALSKIDEQFPNSFKESDWIEMVHQTAAAAGKHGVTITAVSASQPATIGQTAPVALAPEVAATATPAAAPAPTPAPGAAPGAPSAGSPLAESSVTIAATGSTSDIRIFIAMLQSMRRPLLVEGVTAQVTSNNGQTQASITGKTYLTKPLAISAPGATPSPTSPAQ